MTTSEYYRSPGQYVTRVDDKVYGIGPVIVRNQARGVTVQFQYSLYQVQCLVECGVTVHTLASSYSSQ